MSDVVLETGKLARACLSKAVERFNNSRDREMLDGVISAGEMLPGSLGERAVAHRLAVHLERELICQGVIKPSAPIVVDCEYNLHGSDPKALAFEDEQFVEVIVAAERNLKEGDGYYSVSVFPDIVVHQRLTDNWDLLVVEVKRRRKSPDADDDPDLTAYDDLKLRLFTRPKLSSRNYGYQFGCAVLAIDCGENRCLKVGATYHCGEQVEWIE